MPVPVGKFQVDKASLALGATAATRFCATIAIRVAIVLTLVFGAAFAGLHARLAHSPLSMSFLVPPIEKAVNRTLSGLHFDIGDAVLRRSQSGFGIEFRLADVRVLDDDNSPVAESPYASGDVSLRALLTGKLAASHIDLIGPRFYLQYSEERGLALSFADPRDSKGDLQNPGANEAQPRPVTADQQQQAAAPTVTPQTKKEGLIGRTRGRAVNLTHVLTDVFDKTRQGQSAYLKSFGIKDAFVYFDRGDQITHWVIPSAKIDFRHRGKGSAVVGNVSVQSPNETFQFNFRIRQNRRSGQLSLKVEVDDLIPRAFGSEFPQLRLPAMWNMPITASADMVLANNGDILNGTIQATLKQGEFYAPWDQKHPAVIDHGDLHITYSREDGTIQLTESEIRWGESRLKLSGALKRQPETGLWAFQFGADELVLGAQQFGLPVIPLDSMQAKGAYDPKRGAITLDRYFVQAADANISLAGQFIQGQASPAIQLTGRISPMPIAFFKLIWPKFIAYGARDWIGRRIPSGRITAGNVKIDIPADLLASLPNGGHLPPEAIDLRLDLEDLDIHYVQGLPPMHIAKGTAQLAGQKFFFNAPNGRVVAPSGETVAFGDGQFIVGDLRPHVPRGEIHFKSDANAGAVLSLLDHPNLGYISALKMPVPEIDGKVSSTFSIAMPMYRDLKFKDMKLNGRSHLENMRATNIPGGFGVHGGKLNFDVTEKAIEARGEMIINGLTVLGAWQRIFDAPPDRQPPLRLQTMLDDKARGTLGLNVDHLIQGGAAAELTVNFRDAQPQLHFEFNLTEADILIASLGWRKPPGQRAVLSLDMEAAKGEGFELKNINLLGDDLTVRGGLWLNGQRQPVAFDFPVVSLNLQTQMAMKGELAANNIWKVRLKGSSYDGRRFFRSLFSAGKIVENQPQLPEDAPGIDIDAEIDSVVGFFDTTLKNVKFIAQRRDNKLSYLDLHGQLNGEAPLAARIQPEKDKPRQILAEATDAGAAFRLVGFYPSARGGNVSLWVNLDGSGTTQKSGILYARDFIIANDQVVEEVLSGPKVRRTAQARQQQQLYDQLQFDRMRVPFSVGNGQFSLHDAAINGPLLGATLRGSIDFERESINLAGTYVPFYGINGALGLVPILGDLLISRHGEGLFGITFAVQGQTSQPNVLVNPMSMVAPGFLRQLFEFDQQTQPRIIPPKRRVEQKTGARSSSLPPVTR